MTSVARGRSAACAEGDIALSRQLPDLVVLCPACGRAIARHAGLRVPSGIRECTCPGCHGRWKVDLQDLPVVPGASITRLRVRACAGGPALLVSPVLQGRPRSSRAVPRRLRPRGPGASVHPAGGRRAGDRGRRAA